MKRALHQQGDVVHECAVAQQRGIAKSVQKLFHIEANHGIAVRGESLGEFLVRLPESKIVAEEKNTRLGSS